ncbi:MAG TPA: 2'-5' RNA ligase family protein [Micromonosporaceae bacterium]|jgi:hypothetical protein
MVAAIELYFDPATERRLRTLWTALESAGVTTLENHTHRLHRPHLSLAAADELPPEPVAAALGVLPLGVPLTFHYLALFAGGVLWLGPAPTRALLELHHETVARLDAAGIPIWPLYRPDGWVPHSTLSMAARGDAVARAARLCSDILPLETTLISAAVVDHSRSQFTPLPAQGRQGW